jgi:A/G-specific adenine glycosylase
MPDKNAQFGLPLLDWYQAHKRDLPWRRLNHDPYAVWVSEIMLQQTTVAAVVPFYERWMARFPTLRSLAEAPLDDVLKHWAGLGYYARARNLHRGAQTVLALHGGQVPSDASALLALPGVGRYTAGAIASIAFGRDAPILDANVVRVLSRVYAIAGDPKVSAAVQGQLWALAETLIPPGRAADFNQAMMELGALVCMPAAPKCAACPVSPLCAAYALGEPTAFPQFTQAKKWLDTEDVSVAVRDSQGRVLLAQRSPALPLWGGLWELPRATRQAGETVADCAARAACEAAGVGVTSLRPFGHVKHVVANRRVTLHGWQGNAVDDKASGMGHAHALAWEPLEQTGRYALATPQTRLLEQLTAADAQGQLDFGGAH